MLVSITCNSRKSQTGILNFVPLTQHSQLQMGSLDVVTLGLLQYWLNLMQKHLIENDESPC